MVITKNIKTKKIGQNANIQCKVFLCLWRRGKKSQINVYLAYKHWLVFLFTPSSLFPRRETSCSLMVLVLPPLPWSSTKKNFFEKLFQQQVRCYKILQFHRRISTISFSISFFSVAFHLFLLVRIMMMTMLSNFLIAL